jgi:hypothetical protein
MTEYWALDPRCAGVETIVIADAAAIRTQARIRGAWAYPRSVFVPTVVDSLNASRGAIAIIREWL